MRRRAWTRADVALVALALAAAYLLKRHYSQTGVDGLDWILRPTAALVELATGTVFTREAGVGYLSADRTFVIAKSCAGVNFLIVAFAASVFAFVRSRRSLGGKLALVGGAALAGYLAALCANTVRIAIAVELHPELALLAASAREQLHRLAGTLVYTTLLLVFFVAARRALGGAREA